MEELRTIHQGQELCAHQLHTIDMRLLTLLAVAYLCSYPAIAQPKNELAGNPQAQDPRSDRLQNDQRLDFAPRSIRCF